MPLLAYANYAMGSPQVGFFSELNLPLFCIYYVWCPFWCLLSKVHLCNQGSTVSPFLSRLACWILSLTNKHGITLIPAYIPTHHKVEAYYLSWDQLLLEWHLLPQVAHAAFCLCWTYWHLLVPLITPWKLHYLWRPWG